jgi:hypothetical protein
MWRRCLAGFGILLLAAIIATGVKAFVFNFKIRKPGDPSPSSSSTAAKENGVWVCDVKVDPSSFNVGDETYRVGGAWIEEVVEDDFCLVWFPCRKKLGRNRLCFLVPRYKDGYI